ncbi:unnamed protein product [Blepharisma stoltei]|uniref:Uncharacterized protein n=1 Tax=Blepharisma stoltei TaxID=1481888 RepID=A0AAU9J3K4_9CILI|nr:unnamed protein product [Blepharisma stoltei]
MCKFNQDCPILDENCEYCKNMQHQSTSEFSLNPYSISDIQSLMIQAICQQNEVIALISNQSSELTDKVYKITENIKQIQYNSSKLYDCSSEFMNNVFNQPEGNSTPKLLLQILCGGNTNFKYKIALINEIPNPIYKERSFKILAKIVDFNGNLVTLSQQVHFKIMLFTTEDPPKNLKVNVSGQKIMRGTTETSSDSIISFSKVVFKEVTSHFKNGCFYLVILPTECKEIEPLIIENVAIKARKIVFKGKKIKEMIKDRLKNL